jgi:xanthine dehydrogenase accessory factor
MELSNLVVLIRGGGEIASGVAHKLARAHFRVCMTETSKPMAISRGVAFSEAIYDGKKEVEGIVARRVESTIEIAEVWRENKLPIIIDPEASLKDALRPQILVDAIMAKRNTGTHIGDASLVIGLGPGFRAGKDVHVVVETNNSEGLGKVIFEGEAEKDSGVPIPIMGLTFERVLHAPESGLFIANKDIGEVVTAGEVIARIGQKSIKAPISGAIRALFRSGIQVEKGTKLAEVDPTANIETCYIIRAKVRVIAEGVLEAILTHFHAENIRLKDEA